MKRELSARKRLAVVVIIGALLLPSSLTYAAPSLGAHLEDASNLTGLKLQGTSGEGDQEDPAPPSDNNSGAQNINVSGSVDASLRAIVAVPSDMFTKLLSNSITALFHNSLEEVSRNIGQISARFYQQKLPTSLAYFSFNVSPVLNISKSIGVAIIVLGISILIMQFIIVPKYGHNFLFSYLLRLLSETLLVVFATIAALDLTFGIFGIGNAITSAICNEGCLARALALDKMIRPLETTDLIAYVLSFLASGLILGALSLGYLINQAASIVILLLSFIGIATLLLPVGREVFNGWRNLLFLAVLYNVLAASFNVIVMNFRGVNDSHISHVVLGIIYAIVVVGLYGMMVLSSFSGVVQIGMSSAQAFQSLGSISSNAFSHVFGGGNFSFGNMGGVGVGGFGVGLGGVGGAASTASAHANTAHSYSASANASPGHAHSSPRYARPNYQPPKPSPKSPGVDGAYHAGATSDASHSPIYQPAPEVSSGAGLAGSHSKTQFSGATTISALVKNGRRAYSSDVDSKSGSAGQAAQGSGKGDAFLPPTNPPQSVATVSGAGSAVAPEEPEFGRSTGSGSLIKSRGTARSSSGGDQGNSSAKKS